MILHLQRYWKRKDVSVRIPVKVINHFSHNGGMTHGELEGFAGNHGLIAAYDGMNVSV